MELPFEIDDLDDTWLEKLLDQFCVILEEIDNDFYDHVFNIIHDEVILLLNEMIDFVDEVNVIIRLSHDTGSLFMKITPEDQSLREVVKVTFSGDQNIFYTRIDRETLKMKHGFSDYESVVNEVRDMLN